MKMLRLCFWTNLAFALFIATLSIDASAQEVAVLTGEDLTRVVPAGFYFEGRSGPTQMRNATAVRFGTKRYVIAALVDTAGYAADVLAKYEGFLITDSSIVVGDKNLPAGAYGFGFSKDDKLNVLDLGGNPVMSVSTTKDSALRNPRPLMLVKGSDGIRFYHGRSYVGLSAK